MRNLPFIVSWVEILRYFAPQNDITVISNDYIFIRREILPSCGRQNDIAVIPSEADRSTRNPFFLRVWVEILR